MRGRARCAALAAACALLASCTPSPPDLEELAKPPLDRLDATVRAQIETALDDLESRPAESSAVSRGEAWGALGRLYDVYQFQAAAAVCYRNARALAPGAFEWQYLAGRLARSAGDLAEAETALEAALSITRDEPAARAELARLRFDQRRLPEANEIAEALIAEDPSNAAGLLLRARIATELGQWRLARDDYERLLALQPQADRLHRPLALVCRALGDLECAKRHLAQQGPHDVVLQDPWLERLKDLRSGVNGLLDRALTLYQDGDFAAAERVFSEALALDPSNARAHLDRGAALKDLGRLDEALAEFDEAAGLQPDYSEAHYNRGVVLSAQGDDTAALAAYDRALDDDPKNSRARFNRANSLRRLGRAAEALSGYTDLVEEDPANGAARLGRAMSLVSLGRDHDALETLEESDRLFPRSPTFKDLIARVLVTSVEPGVRDPKRGLAIAQRLVSAGATVQHVETLAMAQAAAGDFDGAIRNLEAALAALERTGRAGDGAALAKRLAEFKAGRAPRDLVID